jgi:hypothetical protein
VDIALPKALKQVVDAIVDRDFAGRVEAVFKAAASCIEALQLINLVSLEPKEAEEGSADLGLWELMAPAVRDTVLTVNGLCEVIEAQFPAGSSRSGLFSADASDDRAEAEAALVFQAVVARLKRGVGEVGSLLKNPEFIASRWALLGELQRLRGDFRRRVGDAVFLAAAACAPVRRDDVVPQAAQEVTRALAYRQTAAELCRQLEARLARGGDPATLSRQLLDDLKLLVSMPAWRHVRAGPKRDLLEVRTLLESGLSLDDVRRCVEPFVETVRQLSVDASATVLAAHDRSVALDVLARLEQASLHLELGTQAAAGPLAAAVGASEKLKGRTEAFDAVLRRVRKESEDELTPQALGALVELLAQAARVVLAERA